jgi:hypothetical protein
VTKAGLFVFARDSVLSPKGFQNSQRNKKTEKSENTDNPAKSMQKRNRAFFKPAFKQPAVQFVSLPADFAYMEISLV